jgi:hypothetical protein
MKAVLTQGAILWVAGVRKFTFSTPDAPHCSQSRSASYSSSNYGEIKGGEVTMEKVVIKHLNRARQGDKLICKTPFKDVSR